MAETYWPTTATQLDSASKARQLFSAFTGDGVIRGDRNGLAVFADSSGMYVKLPTGSAVVAGAMYNNDAQFNIAIGNGHATLPRIDRIVLRYTFSSGAIAAVCKAGTANATPVPPTLQRDTSIWEVPLAQVAVAPALSTSIASSAVTPEASAPAGHAPQLYTGGGGLLSGIAAGSWICGATVPHQGFPYRLRASASLSMAVSDYYTAMEASLLIGSPGPAMNWQSNGLPLDAWRGAGLDITAHLSSTLDITDGLARAVALWLARLTGGGTATVFAQTRLSHIELEVSPL